MDKEKYVDESWKESVAQDKERLNSTWKEEKKSTPSQENQSEKQSEDKPVAPEETGEVNFLEYISNLVFQAMMYLGQVLNPVTHQPEFNLEQAKYFIDTILMLREKTKGNLTKQEAQFLESSLYELQMNYVAQVEKEENP